MPWELGLAEAQQVLVESGLRERVTLRVDGGLKTGRDVVIAALLGAEEFAFGTVPLIALGCVMARQCHLDTCPVGVATQREDLRRRFPGTPDHVVAFMLFVAEQVRHILAEIGVRRLDDVVGRGDLLRLRQVEGPGTSRLDLSCLLRDPDPSGRRPRRAASRTRRTERPDRRAFLDERLWRDLGPAIERGAGASIDVPITNRDRSVGARLAGEIALRTAGEGLPAGSVTVDFRGVAGQSFGVFLAPGMRFRLHGEAQDYAGKGMSGGEIVIRPPAATAFDSHLNVIAGNTLLYGATGGRFFAAGRVGERFCVRNSGAEAVVEGCGDHGCEYMTRGTAVILGSTGRNFGAGMSGGVAFVYDPDGRFTGRLNPAMVRAEPVTAGDAGVELLRRLVAEHAERTGSRCAAALLADWQRSLESFRKVMPRVASAPATAVSEPPSIPARSVRVREVAHP